MAAKNLNIIFFIGPQGSGKGTQAKILAQRLNFFYWEMGGILRQAAKEDSDVGRRVRDLINRGILLDDQLLLQVVADKLSQIPGTQGVIFDGIPRRLSQAEFLLDFLQKQNRRDFLTFFIDIPREISLQRILNRAQIENRKDDTREVVEKRLEQYYQETLPVVEYLKNHTRFLSIDGRPSIQEVNKEINRTLGL